MFKKLFQVLEKSISNYIYNSQDFYNYGNVYISGSLISPFTDLLGISSINNSININNNYNHFTNEFFDLNDNLAISFSNHSNQINNLNISTNLLDIKLNNINSDLQNSKNLIAISSTNIQVENQLQQNQINSLIIQGVSGQVIDTVFGISSSILDSKIGILTGISLPTFGISSNNLNKKQKIIILIFL